MSREAVLLQWEQKIEEADRRESGRFVRSAEETPEPVPLRSARGAGLSPDRSDARPARGAGLSPDRSDARPARGAGLSPDRSDALPSEDSTQPEPKRFERRQPALAPVAERRTITITGQPTPARRRRPVMEAQLAQPDRIALWAFLLGLFLVAVAAGTAHA